jgi:hypothetical protein
VGWGAQSAFPHDHEIPRQSVAGCTSELTYVRIDVFPTFARAAVDSRVVILPDRKTGRTPCPQERSKRHLHLWEVHTLVSGCQWSSTGIFISSFKHIYIYINLPEV